MISVIGIALISAVLYLLVKKYSPEYTILVEIASVILLLWTIYPFLCDVLDFYSDITKSDYIDKDYFKIILKISGVAIITQFTADICKDSGETALASKVEFAGKTIILALSIPMVQAISEFATELIK